VDGVLLSSKIPCWKSVDLVLCSEAIGVCSQSLCFFFLSSLGSNGCRMCVGFRSLMVTYELATRICWYNNVFFKYTQYAQQRSRQHGKDTPCLKLEAQW